jgi:hypothetical protein
MSPETPLGTEMSQVGKVAHRSSGSLKRVRRISRNYLRFLPVADDPGSNRVLCLTYLTWVSLARVL